MKIALVDDSEQERQELFTYLNEYADNHQLEISIDCFESGEAFLAVFRAGSYDLVFMDIFMNGRPGTEIAADMRRMDSRVLLVFLTSSMDFMSTAFSVHAFHYIVKPYQKDDLAQCLTDALRNLPDPEHYLSFPVCGIERKLPYSQVLCLIADSHHTQITSLNGEEFRPCIAFGQFSRQLERDRRFLLVSRGILCNMDYIKTFSRGSCVMNTGQTIPVTLRHAKQLEQSWRNYCFSKLHEIMDERR